MAIDPITNKIQTIHFNPKDVVKMDVPLMIRIFEYVREDVKTDVEIHELSDRIISLSSMSRVLTMEDYDQIVPAKDPEVERIKQLSGLQKKY